MAAVLGRGLARLGTRALAKPRAVTMRLVKGKYIVSPTKGPLLKRAIAFAKKRPIVTAMAAGTLSSMIASAVMGGVEKGADIAKETMQQIPPVMHELDRPIFLHTHTDKKGNVTTINLSLLSLFGITGLLGTAMLAYHLQKNTPGAYWAMGNVMRMPFETFNTPSHLRDNLWQLVTRHAPVSGAVMPTPQTGWQQYWGQYGGSGPLGMGIAPWMAGGTSERAGL